MSPSLCHSFIYSMGQCLSSHEMHPKCILKQVVMSNGECVLMRQQEESE